MLQRKQPRKKELKQHIKPKWEKLKEGEAGLPKVWWKGEKSLGTWRYLGVPVSYLLWLTSSDSSWGEILHLTIKKVDQIKVYFDRRFCFDSEEPTYAEKIQARQVTKKTNHVGIEIFPKEHEVVDGANLYHVWLLPEGFEFPFPMILKEEVQLEHSARNIVYGKKEIQTEMGTATYYLMEDKGHVELKWRQKQEFKNYVCGKERQAIEVIPASANRSPYDRKTCLICLPEKMEIPFGL